ncbi:MAG: DUF3298 domain-containing protein [Lachnoclostridium sp.]|nr:DUF3298 domain-containing protein [Lachnoclostridium sp.]
MKQLLFIILLVIIGAVTFVAVDWDKIKFSSDDDVTERHLWFDTVASVDGHSFGFSGDISVWGGWYYDTIPVGDDFMLSYDSVGPSSLKLSLVTRNLIVDLNDDKAVDKIKDFFNPLRGFRRFSKDYEEILDSIVDEEYGTMTCVGEFSFTVDFPDSLLTDAVKINKFICELSGVSDNAKAKVDKLSVFYAGYDPMKYYRPVYTGDVNDMNRLSDFLAHKTFENWKRGDNVNEMSNTAKLEIRSHIANPRYVTLSKFEYERIGLGHGMYTETFHSLDLTTGKTLSNKDIFLPKSLDKVKTALFETMAADSHYLYWCQDVRTAADVELMIQSCQAPDPELDGTEWEEPKEEYVFELPEGALTDRGVVFSFQPYEISCWAAGAFHFVVPYDSLLPYMTDKARSLIR